MSRNTKLTAKIAGIRSRTIILGSALLFMTTLVEAGGTFPSEQIGVASTIVTASTEISGNNYNGDNVFDRLYGELATSWWTWILETPVLLPQGSHPQIDTGKVDCSIGQHGHFWFIAGFFGSDKVERTCKVPSNISFFFPLANLVYINFAADPPLTQRFCSDYFQTWKESLGDVTITSKIDGKSADKNTIRFEKSPIFSIQMPIPTQDKTNLLQFFGYTEIEFPEWVASANCDAGWYQFVPPLSLGRHKIEWKVESSMQGVLQELSYQLVVVKNKH